MILGEYQPLTQQYSGVVISERVNFVFIYFLPSVLTKNSEKFSFCIGDNIKNFFYEFSNPSLEVKTFIEKFNYFVRGKARNFLIKSVKSQTPKISYLYFLTAHGRSAVCKTMCH